ncbi:cadherin-related family member 2 [Gouania willdenowi]|uniref:Cadherin domain-containing protein n=1 Tax=Gouania willdenowi TaxID=441366 RepID=A0A8C5HU59_GOUWI|nr:cadherin-related family member 2 [Gouania willdenowi]
MEVIIRTLTLLCLICLTNARNTRPDIHGQFYEVCEDTPIGVVAFIINATDEENDPLTYAIKGTDAVFFTVEKNTGTALIQRPLDRESSQTLTLEVTVDDSFTPANKIQFVLIKDANDNRPLFLDPSYDRDVPENAPVDTILFSAQATDADSSIGIRYSIDTVIPPEGISLFSINAMTGDVRLNGSLSYNSLSSFYRLTINATDAGGQCYYDEPIYHSSSVISFISVEDVPDLDPQFIGLPFTASVEENSPPGFSVFKVRAFDPDTGVSDVINFTIENSTAEGLFDISEKEGIISVRSDIDRETVGDTVSLTIKATESKPDINGVLANTTTNVVITILDVNDEKPQFYKCNDSAECVIETNFIGEVEEHRFGSVSINMMVKDLDKTADIELSLEGEDKDVFSVEPPSTQFSNTVVQLIVKNNEKLDYEEKTQMVLQVIAIDKGNATLQSTATVTINILDANDNSPEFPNSTYVLNVAEHSETGTVVAQIMADDPDTMDQNKITYRLLPVSILSIFDVEPNTGSIYVKSSSLLDREDRSMHSATLQARDTAGQVGTTVLEITVTDINDQKPVINRNSYLEFVKEGEEFQVTIEATDADEPNTANTKIVYDIVPSEYSDNFTIDPITGVVSNQGALDREALDPELDGSVELNVTATDSGSPPLSTWVKVTIRVEDVNDNVPEFKVPSYTFSVKEGEQGAAVGSVHAEDLDQTTNFNRVSYSIVDGSFGSFIIRTIQEENSYKGVITVDPGIELNYESNLKTFTLTVEAADLELKTAEVTVVVEVLDVNDERPEFEPTKTKTVKENTTIEAVGSFTAKDMDTNHSLVYELESVRCRCQGSMTPCDWFILEPTGTVKVSPEHTVDYEQCDQAVVTAQVVDEYTEKGRNNSANAGEMVINIEDINDNAPEFGVPDSVFVVVSENTNKGTSVAKVTAKDRDSGIHGQIEFKVSSVQFQDLNNQITTPRLLFEAVTTQQNDIYVGIIQTTEGLEATLKGKYLVTVSANDTGGLLSTTVLDIFTVDESFKVELEFSSSVLEVERKLPEIRRALTAATKTSVEIIALRPVTGDESRASENTIVEAYFVYSNGTALTSSEVETMLSHPDFFPILTQLGLQYIGSAAVDDPEVNPLLYALLGMVGGLIVVLAVITTSLVCTRRNYRRKLKAAKAMNSASMVTSETQNGGAVVPGTNKYTMEGANPVLNLNIDTTINLDLTEESSDVDKVSLNSLDYSEDVSFPEKDIKFNMMLQDDSGSHEYIEPLGAALAQRGMKITSDNPKEGYTNPAFATTDL